MEPKSEENESNTSSDADDMLAEQDDSNPMPIEVKKEEEDLKSVWARIKLYGQKLTALGSNALDKKEQNFTDLRKTVVDLIKDSISLGIKDEIFNTLIVDGDIYGSFQFSKNKRRRKHDGKKDEELYCRICGTKETSEWRRGQDGSKSLCNACGLHYSKILKKERTNASKGVGAIKVNNLLNPSSSDENSDADPQPAQFNSQTNLQRMAFQAQPTPTVYNFHSYTPQAPNNTHITNNQHIPSNPMQSNFRMQRISQPARPKTNDVNTDIARQNPPNNTQANQQPQNASIVIHPPLQSSWKQ